MKVTLEILADAINKMAPELRETHALKTLTKLGQLRTTKDVGIEVQVLKKDFNAEVSAYAEAKATPTALEEKRQEQPTQSEVQQTQPVVEQLPEFVRDMLSKVKE